jgi:hypothetical protein
MKKYNFLYSATLNHISFHKYMNYFMLNIWSEQIDYIIILF